MRCWPTAEYECIDEMTQVDLLVRRLSEVQELLVQLPDDAFEEREALVKRRDELRAKAAAHAAGADLERPTEDLLSEVASLQRQRGTATGCEEIIKIEGRISRLGEILGARGVAV